MAPRKEVARNPKAIMDELNRVMGDGTIRLGNDKSLEVRFVPTGVLAIDVLLEGGIPRGRATEFFGAFSTLKTYVAYRAIAQTQQDGGLAALVDTEHAYDPDWLERLGGRPGDLLVQQPQTGEEAVAVTEVLLRNKYDLIVWDSVAATQVRQFAEKRPGEDNQPGGQARFMSAALRRLNAVNTDTAMLWINQTREKVGVTFGSPLTTPGGKALSFYASYRLQFVKAGKVSHEVDVFDTEKMTKGRETTAHKVKVVLDKSKLNAPQRESWLSFDLETAEVDDLLFVISKGLEVGFIEVPTHGRFKLPHWKSSVHGIKQLRTALEQDQGDYEWLKDRLMGSRSASHTKPASRRRKKGGTTK